MNKHETIATIRRRHGLDNKSPVKLATMMSKAETDAKDPYRFTARISTNTVDRDREVLLPAGMDATEFKKTRTVFWNHNYDMPVASAVSIKSGDRFIDSTADFARRPANYQGEFFPDFARAMVNQRVIRGVSIGFVPTDERRPTERDKQMFGEETERVFTRWKLLEWSLAPMPSNASALVTSVGKAVHSGLLTKSAAGVMFPGVDIPDRPRKKVAIVVATKLPKRKPITKRKLDQIVKRQLAIAEARRLGRINV